MKYERHVVCVQQYVYCCHPALFVFSFSVSRYLALTLNSTSFRFCIKYKQQAQPANGNPPFKQSDTHDTCTQPQTHYKNGNSEVPASRCTEPLQQRRYDNRNSVEKRAKRNHTCWVMLRDRCMAEIISPSIAFSFRLRGSTQNFPTFAYIFSCARLNPF